MDKWWQRRGKGAIINKPITTRISPKLAYKNYWNYIDSRFFRTKILIGGLFAYFAALIFLTIVKIVQQYGLTDKVALLDHGKFNEILAIVLVLFSTLLAFIFVTTILFWHQSFELIDGKIIDYFPTRQLFELTDIEKIILMTPKMAHILVKRPNDTLIKGVYWFGNSQEEWTLFLKTLAANDKDILNKIYFAIDPKVGAAISKSTIDNSYQEISKVFQGINKY